MEDFYELLKFTIPSLVVFVVAFFIMQKFLDNEYRKLLFELKRANIKQITPIRLQAYERTTLFLERIEMENLIKRVNQPSMRADQLHMSLINAIRSEYEHNLSQQIYMSNDAWEAVKNAKEETLKLVHLSMAQLKNKGSAMDLTTAIFAMLEEMETSPGKEAIEVLKKEVRHLF